MLGHSHNHAGRGSARAAHQRPMSRYSHLRLRPPTKVVISVFAAILIPNEVMIYDLCPAGPRLRPNCKMTNITQYKLWLLWHYLLNLAISARTRTKDKYRIVYSDHQRLELEKEFHYSRYITIRRKAELANMIGLSERQVLNRENIMHLRHN